jgi:hypothetical protein
MTSLGHVQQERNEMGRALHPGGRTLITDNLIISKWDQAFKNGRQHSHL